MGHSQKCYAFHARDRRFVETPPSVYRPPFISKLATTSHSHLAFPSQLRSSYKGRRADTLAPGAEEGRDKLRKAAGKSKYPLIRKYPNGETRQKELLSPYDESIVIRREPSELKHLSSRKKRKKHHTCCTQ